jgi:hypothetical protein
MAPTERAKIEAPLLAEVIDSARRNHYDEKLVQSFVSVGVELWLIEHVERGERVLVDRAEYATVFGEEPPDRITSVTPPATAGGDAAAAPAPLSPMFRELIGDGEPPPDDADTRTAEQIRREIEMQQQLPPSRQPLTEQERGKWRLVTQVISSDRLLTVKQAEAREFGLSIATIANDGQLLTFFGAQEITRLERSWSEGMVRLLVSGPVRVVLIVVFLLGLFLELSAPGLGVFGATAAVALLMLVGAPYLAGMAQWWDILLIALGLVLLAAELFVVPGLGVAGFAGAVCLLVGIVGTFITSDLGSFDGQDELGTGLLSTLTAIFAAGVGMWILSRHIHSFPVISRLMLKAELSSPSQPRSARVGMLEAMAAKPQRVLAVGDVGVAATDLRPSGRATFDERMVDVQTLGRFVPRGASVRVTTVDRYVIEVEEVDS